MNNCFGLLTKILLLSVFFFSACASQNALIVGNLPTGVRCIAVMPFITKGDEGRKGKEFLSEFIVSDLFKAQITGILHPRDIRKAYSDAKAKYPNEINLKYAADVGKVLGCDATLWGTINYATIIERPLEAGEESRQQERYVHIVAVEAFLIDTARGLVNWYYDSKKTSEIENDVKVVGKISSEIVYGLLRTDNRPLAASGSKCSTANLGQKLAGLLFYSRPTLKAMVKRSVSGPVGPEVVSKGPKYKFTEEEVELYNNLKRGKKVRLEKLKFDGRTANISKEGILYLFSLGKVLQAIGPEAHAFLFESHVDSTMNTKKDMAITINRAKNIKVFLTKNFKIDGTSIRYKAYGGQKPLLPNLNRRSRMKNRRIELSLFKVKN